MGEALGEGRARGLQKRKQGGRGGKRQRPVIVHCHCKKRLTPAHVPVCIRPHCRLYITHTPPPPLPKLPVTHNSPLQLLTGWNGRGWCWRRRWWGPGCWWCRRAGRWVWLGRHGWNRWGWGAGRDCTQRKNASTGPTVSHIGLPATVPLPHVTQQHNLAAGRLTALDWQERAARPAAPPPMLSCPVLTWCCCLAWRVNSCHLRATTAGAEVSDRA